MWLFVGLGNPGAGYADHRHNVGFMTLDLLAEREGADPWRSKFSGEIAKLRLDDDDALLLKPMTYMNLSGDSVQPCAAFFRVPVERIVVVHDDLDLPFGDVRVKQGGGHGGHNGLRSLVSRLASPEFCRVRIGIGRPPAGFRGEVVDFVLHPFSGDERETLKKTLGVAAESVLDIATRGVQAAMTTRNKRPQKRKAEAKPPPEAGAEAAGQGADTSRSALATGAGPNDQEER